MDEPCLPPVEVLSDVLEEVGLLSHVTSKSTSLTDGLELLATRNGKEKHYGDDVEIECKNLIGQPSHNDRSIRNIGAFLKGDTSLHAHDSIEVDQDLHHKGGVSDGLDVVVIEDLIKVV